MDIKLNHKYTNRLINETSPYLLQHAHNPVGWYPWGDEAFEKAKKEDKLVLVSIGYAACHWCHVMEHESFEDEEVAQIMNEHFVCIKVDREERPDVDHTYMDAVQLMTGHGGWPLNCFTLPDGRPVFGGTYFRKAHWLSILQQLAEVYHTDREKVVISAQNIAEGLKRYNLVRESEANAALSAPRLTEAMKNWEPRFDLEAGGHEGAPKFPMPANYLFLLKYNYFSTSESVHRHLELTLDRMAAGGIYDQLGGGFARYATDAEWKVPHFEKMLYDNAQLVSLYARAFKLYGKDRYKQVVMETLDFVDRELTSPDGVFYAAIDADSEGEEGAFYVWREEETEKLLGADAGIFNAFYGISGEGNWEQGKNVLHESMPPAVVAEKYKVTEAEVEAAILRSKILLFEKRAKKEKPITDDKVLTSWNGLMITAWVDAFRTFGEQRFLEKALKAAAFLKKHCITEAGGVFRMVRKNGIIPGFLDDYGLLAQAYIDLYTVTFDEEWLMVAKRITDYALERFCDDANGLCYYSAIDDNSTFTNKIEISDNVIPSSNSVIAAVLRQFYFYFEEDRYLAMAEKMIRQVLTHIDQHPWFYANWASVACDLIFDPPQVVFTGPEASKFRREFDRAYHYALVAGSESVSELPLLKNRVTGESLIYVCRNRVCKLPVKTLQEAVAQF